MDTIMLHTGTFFVTFILFLVAFFLLKGGNEKAGKIVQMILRLLFLVIIISGVFLAFTAMASAPFQYILKMLCGLTIIGFLEIILAKVRKGEKTVMFWLFFIVFLGIVLYLGYSLPLGYHFF